MKKAKTYAGTMTAPVKFLYNWNKDSIRFRSANPEGNVSYLYIKDTHKPMYVLAKTADEFVEIVNSHPNMTMDDLLGVIDVRSSELFEIINFYIGFGFGDLVPEVRLDGDKQ